MKIVCVSDNHGRQWAIDAIRRKYSDAALMVHCGDSQLPPETMRDFAIVRGNTDFYAYPLALKVELNGHMAMVVHGHRFFSGHPDLKKLAGFAKENGCDIVFFGHSHCYCDTDVDGVRMLNPGSLAYNKDGTEPCFMVAEIEGDSLKAERVSRQSLAADDKKL